MEPHADQIIWDVLVSVHIVSSSGLVSLAPPHHRPPLSRRRAHSGPVSGQSLRMTTSAFVHHYWHWLSALWLWFWGILNTGSQAMDETFLGLIFSCFSEVTISSLMTSLYRKELFIIIHDMQTIPSRMSWDSTVIRMKPALRTAEWGRLIVVTSQSFMYYDVTAAVWWRHLNRRTAPQTCPPSKWRHFKLSLTPAPPQQ